MTFYLQLLFLNFLLVFGAWKLFQKDEIFGAIGDWLYKRLGEYWSKPLFGCPACMSSVYGTIFFFAIMLQWFPWYFWPAHCLVLCGACTVVTFLDHE